MSDPYFKKLFIYGLYWAFVLFCGMWALDLSEWFITSDIAMYVKEHGLEPTRDVAEQLRRKSALKRAVAPILIICISNYVFAKYVTKLGEK